MKNTHETVFSRRLNEALTELGLSQSELARRIKVTPQAVQRWCNGDSSPRAKTLSALAEATGKPDHWFFISPEDEDNVYFSPISQRLTAESERRATPLSADEEQLVNIYRDLPGVERKNMLAAFQSRLEEINNFIENLSKNKQ